MKQPTDLTDELPEPMSLRLKVAFGFFIAAKLMGLGGVAFGFAPIPGARIVGGTLLVLAGFSLATCIALAISESSRLQQQEDADKQAVRRLLQTGDLQAILKESGLTVKQTASVRIS